MKNKTLIFWGLFLLYFIIGHPMVIYYGTNNFSKDLFTVNPWKSLIILTLSIIGWSIILWMLFKTLIIAPFKGQSAVNKLNREGCELVATITESNIVPKNKKGFNSMELKIQFVNFVGTTVLEKIQVNDSRPDERRFESGKTITLRIDKTLQSKPCVVIHGAQPQINKGRIFLYLLLCTIISGAIAGYYFYSFQTENMGFGWRFLVWSHPLLLSPAIFLFLSLLIYYIFRRLFKINPKRDIKFRYYGAKALAEVTSIEQTGTYVNRQPQICYVLKYEDEYGQTHYGRVKEIIPLIAMHKAHQSHISIFYLKEDPTKIVLAKDIERFT